MSSPSLSLRIFMCLHLWEIFVIVQITAVFHQNYSSGLVFCQLHIVEIADFSEFGSKQQLPLLFYHTLFSCPGAYHGLLLNAHLESVESFVFNSYSLFHLDSTFADAGDIVNVTQRKTIPPELSRTLHVTRCFSRSYRKNQ